ncbi:MAG: transcriptional activator NhaR [Acidobacteriota bacterium]|nr:transcriptional activator NhaR [Acidobacteriota bacterium]
MEWLNYHHLLYFWMVARKGSIVKASEELLLAPPTISAQIGRLEDSLGEKLFSRSGRRLVLTEAGQIAFRYADEIFNLGREFTDTLKGRPSGRPLQLLVGVADVLPKAIVYRLIEPAFQLPSPVRVVCREDPPDRLFGLLAVQQLDLILSDAPISPGISLRAFNHPLGECGIAFYSKPKQAEKFKRGFPRSLDGAAILVPTESASLRAGLDEWFESQRIRPIICGEFDDFSLLRMFAAAGRGVFAAPRVLDKEIRTRYGFTRIGAADAVRARFYAISVERKIKNPAVVAICEEARQVIFR